VPSEVAGTLVEILFNTDDVVQVGQTLAIIETEGGSPLTPEGGTAADVENQPAQQIENQVSQIIDTVSQASPLGTEGLKFFSPLVKNIAKEEGISLAELESISGSGKDGRVNKEDLLNYIKNRGSQVSVQPVLETKPTSNLKSETSTAPISLNGGDEIVEMDRMRKLISGYMVASIQTSAHVQSFIEVDVTNIVKWRDRFKNTFEKREGEKLTFTPIFMEAVAKALKDFPGMNISVDGEFIIKRKNINLGMAAALPNGNLIVPVIKNADQLNLVGMAKAVNDLGNRAKAGKLKPDDTQGGTYTVTNVGTFGSVFGTPIINQPQVGILALGAIRKVPAVIETPEGDFIGIRQKMFLSHSYDHRVVDGALGGSFVKRVAEYLEAFDANREI
ncbi:MAG: dihydrolipoamide acetyltransferase family protein, partial [Flavobacterium sp.]